MLARRTYEDDTVTLPNEKDINALVGHRFPGGNYTIAHWENFLLTECTGAEPMPDHLAADLAADRAPGPRRQHSATAQNLRDLPLVDSHRLST